MPFTTRNARYLRISAHTVLPLYIYLDDKHVEWMTDYTLQRVLEDLRPVIGPKLRLESDLYGSGVSNAKKGTVDVHRGDTYQFAYFFRKNEPHAVLIKSRKFVHSPSSAQNSKTPAMESSHLPRPKRTGAKSKVSATKSPSKRAKSKKRARLSDSDEEEGFDGTSGRAASESVREEITRSLRKRTLIVGGYHETDEDGDDVPMVDSDYNAEEGQDVTEGIEGSNPLTTDQNIQDETIVPDPGSRLSPAFNVDMEGEEEKPKLTMKVTYQGFTIYDRCLCLIIEPWPKLRDKSRVRSVAPSLARDSDNLTKLRDKTPMVSVRERTPLFLPELDSRRSATPAPLTSRVFPQVPLFDGNDNEELGDHDDDTDEGGMMAFSQVLKSAGDERAGSADENENEGDVFLGDADERRGDF